MTKMAFLRKHGRFARYRSRFRKDKYCMWCGLRMRKKVGRFSRPLDPTREHLRPRAAGGGGGVNIGAACRRCNNTRGSDESWVPWKSVPDARRGVAYRMRQGNLEQLPLHRRLP